MAKAQSIRLAPVAFIALACGGNDVQHVDPQAVAMTDKTEAFYDDGELQIFQTQAPVQLPIRAPSESERAALEGRIGPFGHHPWVTTADVGVQVTYTLANLDKDSHSVKVIVEPWNEFGKYVPGVSMLGDNAVPNLSGIERMYDLPGVGSGRPSRVSGVLTYDDMDELATDFAATIDILRDDALVPMAMPTGGQMEEDPRVNLVNHIFYVDNRSGSTPYTDKYIPKTIPALVGFDIGLQTNEPANVAIEYSLEIVDRNGDRVLPQGDPGKKQEAGGETFTLGGAAY
jgi:hypothetical protein